MSAGPTTMHLPRCGLLAACAPLALTPAAASARHGAKDKAAPAVCSHDLPTGIARKGGDPPPGIAGKADGGGPPCDAPDGPGQGPDSAPAVTHAPAAPAVVTVIVASSSAPASPCTSRRVFRLRLDRNGRVRTARVMLDGRAIPVTRGRKGSASVLIDLRKRVRGTSTVRTTVVTRKGKLVTRTHRYSVCA